MSFGGGERLTGLLSDPASRGILGASAGLLAAGAPRTDRPVSLGEAISSGLLSGAQAFDAATQRQADQAAADELSALRKARMAALSKPERITPGTDIGKIRLDLAEGRITPQDAERLIAKALETNQSPKVFTNAAQIQQDFLLGNIDQETRDRLMAIELKQENQPASLLSDSPISELPIPDLRAASTGDIPGMFQNAANFVTGMFGSSAFPDTQEAKAQLNLMNEQILTPMVRAMSDKGAVYTQKVLRNLLPQTNLSNQENFARMSQLPSKIQIEIETAEATFADTSQSDAKRATAARSIRELKPLLSAVEKALDTFETPQARDPRGRNRSRGGTVDSSQGPIKFKRVDDGNN